MGQKQWVHDQDPLGVLGWENKYENNCVSCLGDVRQHLMSGIQQMNSEQEV
jgi:hypothetical protein